MIDIASKDAEYNDMHGIDIASRTCGAISLTAGEVRIEGDMGLPERQWALAGSGLSPREIWPLEKRAVGYRSVGRGHQHRLSTKYTHIVGDNGSSTLR
jgi:hypothetical protein